MVSAAILRAGTIPAEDDVVDSSIWNQPAAEREWWPIVRRLR
jgi:hypothetical protein